MYSCHVEVPFFLTEIVVFVFEETINKDYDIFL